MVVKRLAAPSRRQHHIRSSVITRRVKMTTRTSAADEETFKTDARRVESLPCWHGERGR